MEILIQIIHVIEEESIYFGIEKKTIKGIIQPETEKEKEIIVFSFKY